MNIHMSTRLVTVKSVKGKTASRLKQLCRQCLLATKNLFPWKGGVKILVNAGLHVLATKLFRSRLSFRPSVERVMTMLICLHRRYYIIMLQISKVTFYFLYMILN